MFVGCAEGASTARELGAVRYVWSKVISCTHGRHATGVRRCRGVADGRAGGQPKWKRSAKKKPGAGCARRPTRGRRTQNNSQPIVMTRLECSPVAILYNDQLSLTYSCTQHRSDIPPTQPTNMDYETLNSQEGKSARLALPTGAASSRQGHRSSE